MERLGWWQEVQGLSSQEQLPGPPRGMTKTEISSPEPSLLLGRRQLRSRGVPRGPQDQSLGQSCVPARSTCAFMYQHA